MIERIESLRKQEPGASLVVEFLQGRKLEDLSAKELHDGYVGIVAEIQHQREKESAAKAFIESQLRTKGIPAIDDTTMNMLLERYQQYAKKTH